MKLPLRASALLLLLPSFAAARPLLTEPTSTIGKFTFEAGAAVSERIDKFGTPETKYRSEAFPFNARIGLHDRFDVGFYLTYLSHHLEQGDITLNGSRPALFSPFFKFTPWNNLGLMGIWHASAKEKENQELPIARGNDFEVILLAHAPMEWPSIDLNVGYLFRESYSSRMGVQHSDALTIRPGNIFETKAAAQWPVGMNFSLLTELAYYKFGSEEVAGAKLPDSAGEAMDALAGLSWDWMGWKIGAGVAFGLLQERYTSFDLERGAGDITYKFALAYRLKPSKPNQ